MNENDTKLPPIEVHLPRLSIAVKAEDHLRLQQWCDDVQKVIATAIKDGINAGVSQAVNKALSKHGTTVAKQVRAQLTAQAAKEARTRARRTGVHE